MASNASSTYFTGYANEPIGGGNPYYRCVHCKISDPSINGRLEGHLSSCEYRQAMEAGQPYPAPHPDDADDANDLAAT